MDGHRRLDVWQRARALVIAVYALTKLLPSDERFVTATQLRRAAWSVANNIAEGNAKLGARELRRFLDIALGSLAELDSMVVVLGDLYELDEETRTRIDALRKDITGKIFALLRSRGR
jgi:four helix bundle protein